MLKDYRLAQEFLVEDIQECIELLQQMQKDIENNHNICGYTSVYPHWRSVLPLLEHTTGRSVSTYKREYLDVLDLHVSDIYDDLKNIDVFLNDWIDDLPDDIRIDTDWEHLSLAQQIDIIEKHTPDIRTNAKTKKAWYEMLERAEPYASLGF